MRGMSTSVLAGEEVRTGPSTARPYVLGGLAALSVGAAAIHFAVVFEHFAEYTLYGVFFLVLSWAQLIWPSVVPMSPMAGSVAPDALDECTDMDDPDAMPAGPSGPAQAGVITAVVAAITSAGTATIPAVLAMAPRRGIGRSTMDGRHSSTAQPAISTNSRTQLTTSSAPTDSA